MILKKNIQDGKTIYEPITLEDAVANKQYKDEFVFTDEDEKDEFEDLIDQTKECEESDDESEEDEDKNDEGRYIPRDDIESALEKIGKHTYQGARDFDGSQRNLFFKIDGKKSKNGSQLMQIIPFLDEDDVREIAENILNDPSKYDGLDLRAVLPFLSENDCDDLFLKVALDTNKEYKHSMASFAPFVSEECLSKLVDKYIAGELEGVNMNKFYPFLSSKDVKRLFNHIASQNKKN